MAKLTWDHVHIRSRDPEATAQWFERMLGAEVLRSMQQGQPRIDLKLGGANIFIAPVRERQGRGRPQQDHRRERPAGRGIPAEQQDEVDDDCDRQQRNREVHSPSFTHRGPPIECSAAHPIAGSTISG